MSGGFALCERSTPAALKFEPRSDNTARRRPYYVLIQYVLIQRIIQRIIRNLLTTVTYLLYTLHEHGVPMGLHLGLSRGWGREEGRAGGGGDLELGRALVVGDAELRHAGVEVVLVPADHRLRVARLLHSVAVHVATWRPGAITRPAPTTP